MDARSHRRTFLTGTAGALVAASGCVGEIRNLTGRERTTQLSLTISTLPAGDDPYAVRIANRLADNLERSGIDTTVDPMRPDVLLREILVNHDFDLYVGRYPSQGNPDELRSMLYSSYAEESGWQNPFGYSDIGLDELLEEQRMTDDEERIETAREIQRHLVREQPFTVLGFPDRISAYRTDRFEGWAEGGLTDLTDYLLLSGADESTTLRLLLRNDRITRNRNPIAVEHRTQDDLTDLLYEPLVRRFHQEDVSMPWLARSIDIDSERRPVSATIQLRQTPWHDGEPVTAEDVAFTYGFLKDTTLGEFDTPVPTPWRRGRLSLVESVTVESADRFQIDFTTSNKALVHRALTIPILPEHIWEDRADAANIAGIDIAGQTTEALIDSNEDAIGSGPLMFEDATADESMSFGSFRDHFLYSDDTEGIPDRMSDEPAFERIEFTVVPSHDAAVQLLVENEADGSADGLQADVVPRIVRNDETSLTIRDEEPFYHVGFNCRRAPMTDPHFRRTVARHIDRSFIMDTSLGGYGVASEVPLREPWSPEELRWDGEASLPFFGDEGELDVESAQDAFREAGYQYEEDQLVRRQSD